MEIQDVNFTNISMGVTLLEPEFGPYVTPSVVILSVIAVFGFVGNTVMLISLLMGYKRGWSNTDLFILNVVVIDLVVVSINLPLRAVVEASPSFPLGESGCKATVYFPYFCTAAVPLTVLSLVLNAAFQRVLRAPCPRWFVYAAVPIIWVVAFVVPIPPVVHARLMSFHFGEQVQFACTTEWPGQWFLYDTVIFALFVALPTLMLLAFCIVIIAVRRQTTGPQEGRRTDILIIIMAALFVVTYLLYHVTHMYLTHSSSYDIRGFVAAIKVGICLIYLNSAVKPLLCACLYHRFRGAFASCRGRDERAGGPDERGAELRSL
ncbi:SSTR2 [Branchiostoma lanceolatum]|uniref:SSTR2 protein n=1 Tax=Branchiostoma lanceolatum TaxID=7740 RepID=A0A8K0EGX3_BRALA|nr:SSTR2 [Branchiostoma lanceolatum]